MDEIQSKLVDLLRQNPRTIKELSLSLGLSKLEVLSQLNQCGAIEKTTMMFNGRVRPVAVSHYYL